MSLDTKQPISEQNIHFNFVQKRLLLPLAIILFILFSSYTAALIFVQKSSLNKSSHEVLDLSINEFSFLLAEQANSLTALLKILARDQQLRSGLQNENRPFLYACYKDVFVRLRDEHKITHFYFHRHNRTNLLRVHKPDKYGDFIDRFTALKAEQTGQIASGIELGPLGTFTLRAVIPIHEKGQLIGYLELGKEIEEMLADIHSKYGTECIVGIHKKFLKRAAWEQGMSMLGREAEWERYDNHVIIYRSPSAAIGLYDKVIIDPNNPSPSPVHTTINGSTWQSTAQPLQDVSGQTVGELIFSKNISEQKECFTRLLTRLSGATLVILGLLLTYLVVTLRKTDRVLLTQKNKLIQNKNQIEKYVKAIDNMGIGLLLIDDDCRIRECNETLKQWFGDPEEKFCYQWIFDLESPCSFCPLKEVITDKKTTHFLAPLTDGRIFDITSTPVTNLDGTTSMMEVLNDITLQKKAEEQLRKHEERLQILINSTPDIICLKDGKGRWLVANDATLNLFSLTEVDYFGKTSTELAEWTDSAYRKTFLICEENDKIAWNSIDGLRNEQVITTPDGTEKFYDVIKVPILENEENQAGLVVLGRDISEQKEAEEQLRQKHKMEAVGYMAGGMAHNFNNNLAIILGNIELSQLKVQDPKVQEFLKNAKTAILRSRDLVSQIITYSRRRIQNKTPIQLPVIIDETITLLRSTLPATINLQKIVSPDCGLPVIHADASQIQEILVNLCNNAVQAMGEKGELTISLEPVNLSQTDISAQYDGLPGRYAKLSVQDSGCGMPVEILDKIFDPFFTTKEEYEGAGMGLATVQGIVAQHGGVIKVNSIPEQGTVFNIYFPLVDGTGSEEKSADGDMPKGTEKILFVDDDEMLASIGENLLSEMGYQVTIMTESSEALKLFTANPDFFDLMITDQTMPDLTGQELIQKLKKIRPDLRTILCTGYSSKISQEDAEQQGIDAFCMKPLDLPGLLQTVRQVLDEGQK